MTTGGRGGPSCQICRHPQLDQIEADLLKPAASKRAVARLFGIGRMSVVRHAQDHLPERLRRAGEAAKKAPAAEKTLEQLSELNKLARAVFSRGYNSNNLGAALGALSELRRVIELEGRLLGTVKEPGARITFDFALDKEALARMAGAFLTVQKREASVLPETPITVDAEVIRSLPAPDDEADE